MNYDIKKSLSQIMLLKTGFDLICSCCLQYKIRSACENIDVLSSKQQRQFTIKQCDLLKNRSEGSFICNSCKSDIEKDKMPKKSQKNSFRYANFPHHFLEKLKNKCSMVITSLSNHFKEKKEIAEGRH